VINTLAQILAEFYGDACDDWEQLSPPQQDCWREEARSLVTALNKLNLAIIPLGPTAKATEQNDGKE
jgi:hypothetical protein